VSAPWLEGMNPEQVQAINHGDGPARVLAVAGSGKTASLCRRVMRLVEEQDVDPSRILITTFSRKAAGEMASRLRVLGVPMVQVNTWHSLALRILREDQTEYARWEVDEKDRHKTIVRRALGHENENWRGADLGKVRKFLRECRANLMRPEDPATGRLARRMFRHDAPRAVRVFHKVGELTEAAMLLTFDDMLAYVWDHLVEDYSVVDADGAERQLMVGRYREAAEQWSAKFDYVMTDEVQDDSLVQVALRRALAQHRNVLVVGDATGQAIYSFRGSDPRYLRNFAEEWEGTTTIHMNRNYRSGRAIVEAANAVIAPDRPAGEPPMVAERDLDGEVHLHECDTQDDEAEELAATVRAEIEDGRSPDDVFVLYRLNAQSRAVEAAFLRSKIPYTIVGGINFYERKEVKDLLAYLRVAAEERGRDAGDAIKRCINAPFRFLGARFVEKLMDVALRNPESSWEACVGATAEQAGIQSRQVSAAMAWVEVIGLVRGDVAAEKKPYEILTGIIGKTGFIRWLEQEEGEESVENSHAANVRELLRVSQNFKTVAELLAYVDQNVAQSRRESMTKRSAQVTLMSCHRSKGMERDFVWVIGCNEDVLPHVKGDVAEERRIMYVAVTRARDVLHLSWVREMATRTGVREMQPSRFLQGVKSTDFGIEIPESPECSVCETTEEVTFAPDPYFSDAPEEPVWKCEEYRDKQADAFAASCDED
jgi:DNA helicase-2/ATP-dependent DNA helicase PcrA